MALVIGLTGNIGTGKSTVLRMLAELGAYTIDADQVAHRVIAPDGPAYRAVVEAFGPQILQADGRIDRRRLASRVFSDPTALARLEAIVHPAVYEEVRRMIQEVEARARAEDPEPVVAIEAIKLLESGRLLPLCDQIWVVTASPEQQIRRLAERRGLPEAEARRRMAAQSPQEEKVQRADVVIDNSGSLANTKAQVRAAWAAHVEPRRRGGRT